MRKDGCLIRGEAQTEKPGPKNQVRITRPCLRGETQSWDYDEKTDFGG